LHSTPARWYKYLKMNLFAFATFTVFGIHLNKVSSQMQTAKPISNKQLTVTTESNTRADGFMFDVEADQVSDVTINAIWFDSDAAFIPTYGVWYKEGSFVGHNTDESAWTLAGSGKGSIVPALISNDFRFSTSSRFSFTIPAGQTYGIYIYGISPNYPWLVVQEEGSSFTDVVASDEHIKVYTGLGVSSSCGPFGEECGNDFYVTPTVKLMYTVTAMDCSIDVLSVDHKFGPSVMGKYFNFDKSVLDMILGRTDWSNERFDVDKGTVVVWRNPNGGSVGDAHGRFDTSAKAYDWEVGDKITFLDCVKQN